jgi:hypothetical protein
MNTASFKKQIKNLAQSKIVLYILLILSVTNLFGYLMSENFAAVLLFLVIGYLTTYFTDNMITIFLVSIVVTNFTVAINNTRNKEGMENNKNKKNKKTSKKIVDENSITVNGRGSKYDNLKNNPITGRKSKNTTTVEALDNALDNKKNPTIVSDDNKEDNIDGTCTGNNCKVSKQRQIENAHSLVDKMLTDPQQLQKHQEQIKQTIETLEPMIEKVEGMMDKIGGSKIMGLLGGLGPMLNNANN